MNPRSIFRGALALLAMSAFLSNLHAAGVPQTINYQGYLATSANVPVTATQSMAFSLYNATGDPLWTETQIVTITNGVFNVTLGSVTPISLPFDVQYFLGVKVGTDAEMMPRQALGTSPYAFRAATADAVAATATVSGSQITGPIATATIAGSQVSGAVASATSAATATTAGSVSGSVPGSQIAGPITTATISGSQVSGAVASATSAATATTAGSVSGPVAGSQIIGAITSATIAGSQVGGAISGAIAGDRNTAVGASTLVNNTTGSLNTAGGANALLNNTTGGNNTASGVGALGGNTTGNNNIALGASAGASLTTGQSNIAIGNPGVAGESGAIRIGTGGAQTKAFIAGISGVTPANANPQPVVVDSNGQLGSLGTLTVGTRYLIPGSGGTLNRGGYLSILTANGHAQLNITCNRDAPNDTNAYWIAMHPSVTPGSIEVTTAFAGPTGVSSSTDLGYNLGPNFVEFVPFRPWKGVFTANEGGTLTRYEVTITGGFAGTTCTVVVYASGGGPAIVVLP